MAQVGGCFCGGLRYTVEGAPIKKAICHCADCRKITGSTYSTNAIYKADGFKLTKGTPKEHSGKADSGNVITSHFCPDCGVTLWRDGAGLPGLLILKVGTLDDPNALGDAKPEAELYAPGRVSWVAPVEGAAQVNAMS
ncbi:hypothetical protein P280DRAFT_505689 [Massarina eburnea CBS 473.64]|uniref:CENP-V/GFA domain-containing protein n=1 Tax=Massarina eburnea CBS 473.64 TaxID=1395130 RepID=A0A6A6S6V9_9PLEO|nr:hypothetical protein P280DRAFT_505689 [Massarina eburnea CBS 473.64]